MKHLYSILLIICTLSCNNEHEIIISKFPNGATKEIHIYKNKNDLNNYDLTVYFESGNVRFKGKIRNKLFTGEKINYYENGHIKQIDSLISPCILSNCCCDGIITRFDSTGIISERYTNIDGVENGLVHVFKDGKLDCTSNYVNGQKNGTEYAFYKSGKVQVLANYINDTITGFVYFFKENGDTLKYHKFNNDKIAFPYKKWLPNGNVLYGDFIDKSESQVLWIWYDQYGNKIKQRIDSNKNSGYITPE